MSSPSLIALTPRVFFDIFQFLSHQDLVRLACTSKAFQELIEPLLWTHIELFPPYHHETFDIKGICTESSTSERRYRTTEHDYFDSALDAYQRFATAWFVKLGRLKLQQSNTSRVQKLCAYTRSLSAPVRLEDEESAGSKESDFWALFPLFINLEKLELVVGWQPPVTVPLPISSPQPFSKLSRVKLYGYVPKSLVHYILLSAPTLERIDMGLLDEPTPGAEFERKRQMSPLSHDAQQDNIDLDDLQLFDDNVAPRPLRWVPDTIPALPRLTHLHLCRPTEMDPAEFCWGRIHHSTSAEELCLKDWARLLRAVRSTLEYLVIDQRPAAHENALEGGPSDEFMRFYSQPSSRRLVRMMEPLLREVEFPRLVRIDFAGVLVNEPLGAGDAKLRRDLMEVCEAGGIACVFSLSRRCVFEAEEGTVYGNDGMGADDF